MLPHIKQVNLWICPSGCSAPESFTGPDTHTSLGFALSSFQLLESPAGSLLDLTPDYRSFSSAPAGLLPLGVQHGLEQEQTLSMQHLLKSILPPWRWREHVLWRHKALWSCFSHQQAQRHPEPSGQHRNMQTPTHTFLRVSLVMATKNEVSLHMHRFPRIHMKT